MCLLTTIEKEGTDTDSRREVRKVFKSLGHVIMHEPTKIKSHMHVIFEGAESAALSVCQK